MRILILNQAFYPDVVSTAQHAADLARGLAQQGHQVTVIASARGYDDRSRHFAAHEVWNGVEIFRVRPTGLGKGSRWRRAADFASFLVKCAARLAVVQRCDVVVAMTSPPLISLLAALAVPWKAKRLVCWCMDLNPDEAVAAGWLRAGSATARVLEGLLRHSLRAADRVVVLDRFMKARLEAKGVGEEKIAVVPPWPHDDCVAYDAAGREEFRREHGLSGKFVVMYSGNHSPCHPLETLLEAADELKHEERIVFCFVGGGSELKRLRGAAERKRLSNVRWLPYQPLEKLAGSLSAADLHVVAMGEGFAGIVHPCKIYNIMATRSPFLYLGPGESHIADLVKLMGSPQEARVARHGEVAQVSRHIREALAAWPAARRAYATAMDFGQQAALPRMIEAITGMADGEGLPVAPRAKRMSA